MTLVSSEPSSVALKSTGSPSDSKAHAPNAVTSSSGTPAASESTISSTFEIPYAFPMSMMTSEPTPSANSFPLHLPDSFQWLETTQAEYGNMLEGSQNLSFMDLLALPLGVSLGKGFLLWNAGNWGLGNMLPHQEKHF